MAPPRSACFPEHVGWPCDSAACRACQKLAAGHAARLPQTAHPDAGPSRISQRGEIAARVLRSAQALGYPCVAVYSDADRDAPYVAQAEQAVRIGPAAVSESYLNAQALLMAADRTGADAVHPGYGFLSERAEFAQACAWAGITFVGPSVEAITLMGDKAQAKARMLAAGVPCLPGYQDDAQDLASFAKAAESIGYPLLVKAAAGGGGRGMRRVNAASELEAGLNAARSEAENAFGDGRLLLEKLVERARHIEVQVIADEHGTTLHLGERECSAQRRYQKVIEESPSPAVNSALRARLGEAAVSAASAIGYVGAGTVEFLLAEDGAFYFLEMNTRLQVEHPVTELVYGVDLVELQLRVAAGEPLGISQDEVVPRGHAIEARLYAEDPAQGFLPQAGELLAWQAPSSDGVRCDHALNPRDRVSSHYDPMLAKVIASGPTREDARRRLTRALGGTLALGVSTNRGYLLRLLGSEAFRTGQLFTDSLASMQDLAPTPEPSQHEWALAFALGTSGPVLPRRGGVAYPVTLSLGEVSKTAWVHPAPGEFQVRLGEHELRVELRGQDGPRVRVCVDGVEHSAGAAWTKGSLHLACGGNDWTFAAPIAGSAREAKGDGVIRAPAAGRLIDVRVAPGDPVEPDRVAAVLESMKIETELRCAVAGTVRAVHVASESQVKRGQVLIEIDPHG